MSPLRISCLALILPRLRREAAAVGLAQVSCLRHSPSGRNPMMCARNRASADRPRKPLNQRRAPLQLLAKTRPDIRGLDLNGRLAIEPCAHGENKPMSGFRLGQIVKYSALFKIVSHERAQRGKPLLPRPSWFDIRRVTRIPPVDQLAVRY
jgi:hypothetical protein